MAKKISNDGIVSATTQALQALQAHLTAKTEVPVAGGLMKVSAIAAALQRGLDTRSAAATARGAYKAALAARTEADVTVGAINAALRPWVLNRFGADSAEAHAFGYSARKVTAPSAETKAKAVLLNRATREARGTVGKKAKLKIKGTLVSAASAAAPVAGTNTAVAKSAAPAVVSAPVVTPAPAVSAPAVGAVASGGNASNGAVLS